ncbi:MAG: Stk1 family PASTA domain-containing Ser/Thr kinase [Microthrixaceae bacterium]
MAEVFLARDRSLDRPVAVKILFPEFATDPAFVERFRREAQAAANLSHPNIVGVYDWGSEAGTYYIVMEYVDGQSLAEVIRDSGPLQPRRAAEIVDAVASALGSAHQRGVVHRDVKPGNVLISTTGVPKVADFGIARALTSPDDDLTQAGSVMGTATYFSPEQAQGFPVDARSDLYSLGVVLYECLCGRAPFVGDSPVSIAYQHVQEWPPQPSEFVLGVPASLECIILKLLAKKPDQRYASAEELRADLRRFLDGKRTVAEDELGEPVDATVVANPAVHAAPTIVASGSASPGDAPPEVVEGAAVTDVDGEESHRRSNAVLIGVTAVMAALLAGLGYWLVSSLNHENEAPTTVAVPNVVGRTLDIARERLGTAGFTVRVVERASDRATGTVTAQDPSANALVAKGSQVVLTVSSGPRRVQVPPVRDLTEAAATEALTEAGLVARIERVASSDIQPGHVVDSSPPSGTSVAKDSEVTLRVSTGAESVTVPAVAGKTLAEATRLLTDAGFKVGESPTRQPSANYAEGLVISSDPVGNAPKGSTVNLTVSSGPEEVKVPSVKGMTEADARAALTDKGFVVETDTKALGAGDPNDGRVVQVVPSSGALANPGSVVKITVGAASPSPTTGPSSSTTSAPTSTTGP